MVQNGMSHFFGKGMGGYEAALFGRKMYQLHGFTVNFCVLSTICRVVPFRVFFGFL